MQTSTAITVQTASLLTKKGNFFSSSYMRLRSLKGYSLTEFMLELSQNPSREFVLLKSEDELIGAIRLSHKDQLAQTIKLNLFCNSTLHISALSSELRRICSQLFLSEHIRRVYCFVLENEVPEQHVLLHAGFIKEAMLNDHAFYCGQYHAVIIYGWVKNKE